MKQVPGEIGERGRIGLAEESPSPTPTPSNAGLKTYSPREEDCGMGVVCGVGGGAISNHKYATSNKIDTMHKYE